MAIFPQLRRLNFLCQGPLRLTLLVGIVSIFGLYMASDSIPFSVKNMIVKITSELQPDPTKPTNLDDSSNPFMFPRAAQPGAATETVLKRPQMQQTKPAVKAPAKLPAKPPAKPPAPKPPTASAPAQQPAKPPAKPPAPNPPTASAQAHLPAKPPAKPPAPKAPTASAPAQLRAKSPAQPPAPKPPTASAPAQQPAKSPAQPPAPKPPTAVLRTKESNASKLCTFPEVDPFDPSLEKTLSKKKPLDCSPGVPNLVRLDNDTLVVLQEKVTQALKKGRKFESCRYQALKIKANSNDRIVQVLSTRKSFTVSMKVDPTDEEIRVECFDTNKTVISRSWFAFVRENAEKQNTLDASLAKHLEKDKPVETLSVLMIGADALAKQHFARAMPKTRDFLLGAYEMHKHGKLGYSTFPNVIGLLTNRTEAEFRKDPRYKYKDRGYMDQINDAFIWSDARRLGYRTAMVLDDVYITAFHYLKRGYKVPPVDHYPRGIVVDSVKYPRMRRKNRNCYGDTPEVTKMYDYWLQLLHHYNSTRSNRTPFFAYSFLTHLTHDDYNMAFAGDLIYLEFLKKLKASNALNNTVIVWFSDHGERFGKIRHTYQGSVETNTPLLFYVFPPWFEKKYPDVMRVFKINQHRLTSHYDTYATMKDLLRFKGVPGPKGTIKERAISLFREIPEERTCKDAGIPAEYCVCARFSKPKLSPALDNYLGMVLRNKVQSIVKPHSARCAELRLGSVESILEESGPGHKAGVRTFRVSIITEPGNATFEATLAFTVRTKTAAVVGEVARTNMYRGQADCMDTVEMRRYCYCKNLL